MKSKEEEEYYLVTYEEMHDACCRMACLTCYVKHECTQKNHGFCAEASNSAKDQIAKMKFKAQNVKFTTGMVLKT